MGIFFVWFGTFGFTRSKGLDNSVGLKPSLQRSKGIRKK